jgi:uncharacterized membrane protein
VSEPEKPADSTQPEVETPLTGESDESENLPQVVEEAIEGVVEGIVDELADELADPAELRRVVSQIIVSRIESTEGAFPPPSMLERYEAIHPGFTRDLMDEFKAEGDSRRALQSRSLTAGIVITVTGQVFAFLIAFAGLGFGAYLINGGHSIAGYAVLVTAVGGIVASFLYLQKNRGSGGEASDGSDSGGGSPSS